MYKVTTLTLRISAEEKEAFAKYCKENDLPMSQVIRKLMRDYLKENLAKE